MLEFGMSQCRQTTTAQAGAHRQLGSDLGDWPAEGSACARARSTRPSDCRRPASMASTVAVAGDARPSCCSACGNIIAFFADNRNDDPAIECTLWMHRRSTTGVCSTCSGSQLSSTSYCMRQSYICISSMPRSGHSGTWSRRARQLRSAQCAHCCMHRPSMRYASTGSALVRNGSLHTWRPRSTPMFCLDVHQMNQII